MNQHATLEKSPKIRQPAGRMSESENSSGPGARRQGDADTANRQEELRVERDVLDEGIDAARVRTALLNFQPVWSQLFPAEQERILRLLIDHVRYDPDTQDVEVALRDTGIGALAAEAT